jgi:hypothetical protein
MTSSTRQADMLIDETYYIGIPSALNISRSLGFLNVGEAQATVPAFTQQQVYRCVWTCCPQVAATPAHHPSSSVGATAKVHCK